MRRRFIFVVLPLLAGVIVALAELGPLHFDLDKLSKATHDAVAKIESVEPSSTTPQPGPTAPAPQSRASDVATLAATGDAAKPATSAAAPPAKDAPSLSIARISRDGTSVFAGTAVPFSHVTVLENDTPVATATANASGDWSLETEHKFESADPKINLHAGALPVAAEAAQSAASPPPAAELKDKTPPAVQVLKQFEEVVARAREEAKHPDTGSPVALAAASPPAEHGTKQTMTTTPVPMTFIFDEATLTPEGQKAANLLLEYLMLKKFADVTLTGHADERGTAEYNMDLSRQRLETIMHLLRDGGYRGKLDLVPKGATEPYMGVDRSKYAYEDLMQLDRRVELRVAQ